MAELEKQKKKKLGFGRALEDQRSKALWNPEHH